MKESTLIRVPASRAKQLRALAQARNTTMTGLIDELVSSAIATGSIPDDTPGLVLKRLPSSDLEIVVNGERYVIYRDDARALFKWLGEEPANAERQRTLRTHFGVLALRKAGTTLILEIKRTGRPATRFSMPGKIRIDVRRQVSNAYKDDRWSGSDFRV